MPELSKEEYLKQFDGPAPKVSWLTEEQSLTTPGVFLIVMSVWHPPFTNDLHRYLLDLMKIVFTENKWLHTPPGWLKVVAASEMPLRSPQHIQYQVKLEVQSDAPAGDKWQTIHDVIEESVRVLNLGLDIVFYSRWKDAKAKEIDEAFKESNDAPYFLDRWIDASE